MRALGQDTIMSAGGSRSFDESTGTYRSAAPAPPLTPDGIGPSMTAISPAGLCFDGAGRQLRPAGPPGAWPPWYTGWSPYLAPKRERTPTMYTRPASAFFTPPHERALARLGAPALRRWTPGRGLAALGQDFTFFDPTLDFTMPALTLPPVDVSSGFFSGVDWGAIGSAAGSVLTAATPLALPLLSQAIYGTKPAPRPAPPVGYTYAPTGQLVRLPSTMTAPTPSTWSTPLLLLGGAAVVGGAIYFTRKRR